MSFHPLLFLGMESPENILRRLSEVETRCSDLARRMEKLELGRTPTEAESLPLTDIATETAISSRGMTNETSTRGGNEVDARLDATMPEIVDIDDLLSEAQAVGRGVYDDDMRDLIDLYTVASPPEPEVPQPPLVDLDATSGAPIEDQVTTERRPTGQLHLVLGDSMATDLRFTLGPNEHVLNRAEGGNTWRKQRHLVKDHIRQWEEQAAIQQLRTGKVFIWLGGNEAYGRPGRHYEEPRGLYRRDVEAVLEQFSSSEVIIAGPVPRLWHDSNLQWEATPAYHADQELRVIGDVYGAQVVPYLGRALTSMYRRQHVIKPEIARHWYRGDGVHLTQLGERKLARKLHSVFL